MATNKPYRAAWPHLLFLLILILFATVYYGDIIGRLPISVHAWAQGDRLSLAYGFYDNGMDFFHPATSNQGSDFGIVGVEFPLQAYVVAALAHIFGRGSINSCFRLVDILIAITGLYFLFSAIYKRSGNFFLSLFPPIFFFCSPVYIFYSGNYLPDPASVSVTFIGFYFLLEYIETGQWKSLVRTLLVLMVAALIKTSTIHYLCGVMAYALYRQLSTRESYKVVAKTMMLNVVIIGILVANYLHIQYLNDHYHSGIFLSKINSFVSWNDVGNYIDRGFKDRWVGEYFLVAHYPVYVSVISVGLYLAAKHKEYRPAFLPMILFLVGAIIIGALFGKQLMIHDYYILPIFFPALAFILMVAVICMAPFIREPRLVNIGLTAMLLTFFFFADHQTYQRFHREGIYYTGEDDGISWMNNGRQFLQELKIPQQEKIMVAGEDPPNLSLIYFDRKGHTMPDSWWNQQVPVVEGVMKERNTRVLIMRTEVRNQILRRDSLAFKDFQLMGIKDHIAVWKMALAK